MLSHLVQTVRRVSVVYSINVAVTFSRFCAREVREASVFNVNYLLKRTGSDLMNWRISDVFYLALLLALCAIRVDTGGEW